MQNLKKIKQTSKNNKEEIDSLVIENKVVVVSGEREEGGAI